MSQFEKQIAYTRTHSPRLAIWCLWRAEIVSDDPKQLRELALLCRVKSSDGFRRKVLCLTLKRRVDILSRRG